MGYLEGFPGRWFTAKEIAAGIGNHEHSTMRNLRRLAEESALYGRLRKENSWGAIEFSAPVFALSRFRDGWRTHAECEGLIELFLPDLIDGPHNPRAQKAHNGLRSSKARKMCRSCPVQGDCHEYIQSKPVGERIGTWGGVTYEEGPTSYRYQLGPWLVKSDDKRVGISLIRDRRGHTVYHKLSSKSKAICGWECTPIGEREAKAGGRRKCRRCWPATVGRKVKA